MSKRPKEKLSYSETMQDLMEWVDNGGDEEDIQEINEEDDQDRVSEDAVSDEEDGTIDNEVEQTRPPKHRKTLPRSRNVNSIDASLDEDNFEPIHYVNGMGCGKLSLAFLDVKVIKALKQLNGRAKFQTYLGDHVEQMSFVLQFFR